MTAQKQRTQNSTTPLRDLTGQKFNMLTVETFSHYSESRHPYWNCACDCGNTAVVCEYNLFSGNTKSCGCLKVKRGKTFAKDTTTHYAGTQIEMIAAKVTRHNNTSGFRGVSWVEKTNKWRSNLTFRGVRHHLGYYSSFEDAVGARLKGEEMVDSFLIDYYDSVPSTEATRLAKLAFENQIHAKAKAEAEFRRVVCNHSACDYISSQMVVTGDINTQENLIISGTVVGDIHCSKSMMINGKTKGHIYAEAVYLPNGKVIGDITAKHIFCSNVHGQILGKVMGSISPYTHIESADIEGGFQL